MGANNPIGSNNFSMSDNSVRFVVTDELRVILVLKKITSLAGFQCRLLHLSENTTAATTTVSSNANNNVPSSSKPITTTTLFSNSIHNHRQIILATAIVAVQTPWGDQPIRLLVDSGSESSFITDKAVHRLRLKKTKAHVSVTGLGGSSSGLIKGLAEFTIKSTHNNFLLPMEALVLPKITFDLPRTEVNVESVCCFSES